MHSKRQAINQGLGGLAVLMLCIVSGYLGSRTAGFVSPSAGPASRSLADEWHAIGDEVQTVADEGTNPTTDPTETPAAQSQWMVETAWTGRSIRSHVNELAARHGVPAGLVVAIIAVESEFDPLAISRRGALGLMQLMPDTAEGLDVDDPFDPRENLDAGIRLLKQLIERFDNNLPLVLAAYNAGPQTVVRYGGVPPYGETRRYVRRVMRRIDRRTLALFALPREIARPVVTVNSTRRGTQSMAPPRRRAVAPWESP